MDTKTWDVPAMEDKLSSVKQIANMLKIDESGNIAKGLTAHMGVEKREKLFAAARELEAVMDNTEDNPTGLHLNRISSGTVKYNVVKEAPSYDGEDLFVGTFDTKEQAEEAMTEDTRCIEYDPDEWWAVLNKESKNVTKMLYPTQIRALAFLYQAANPPKWSEYAALCEQ